tara:strand:- start:862 stop:1251 length:390 start_codon:yes stop_codon:yes gene_type:complete
MKNEKIYPDSVEEKTQMCMEALEKAYAEMPEFDFDKSQAYLRDSINNIFFQQWLKGDDDEIGLDEEKIYRLMLMAEASHLLDSLEKKGYIDSIDDEDGNEVVFLTTKGKNDMALINKDVDKLLHNIILN